MKVSALVLTVDVLKIRSVTLGIHDHIFPYKGKPMHFIDVAGQKQFRKRWLAHFSDVHAILFVASLACYDQMMVEEPETNRMVDSLKVPRPISRQVFEMIVNHKLLVKPDIILFLNKRDLFEEKIKKSSIAKHFPGFNPGTSAALTTGAKEKRRYELGIAFFRAKFLEQVARPKRDGEDAARSYKTTTIHTTCCTDTGAMKKILVDVVNAIIKLMLSENGMI
ncbi:hypothetical protein HDV03_000596 [Kappamyces sp. JEL0829]|nr:hypothetical protein HDV03_000596 [Kappamyces sp. JEL0829]